MCGAAEVSDDDVSICSAVSLEGSVFEPLSTVTIDVSDIRDAVEAEEADGTGH